jgi:hypothetical protein
VSQTDPRPKTVLKEFLREYPEVHNEDVVVPWLYSFVYWLEGQDKSSGHCRYHIMPAGQTLAWCPFAGYERMETDDSNRTDTT